MAKEWYLIKTPHATVSGYEQEAHSAWAQEAFEEALDTDIAEDVEICNFDLSERTPIRACMLGSLQDTQQKTMTRQMLCPVGSCHAGMYVYYKERYWLIIGLVDNNGMYEKAACILCNHLLTWLGTNGGIVQRWANVSSASSSTGETSTERYIVRSGQLLITLPDDDESLLLSTGQRFVIDRRCEVYEKDIDPFVTVDTSYPVLVYRLTRSDSVLFNYQDSGHHEIMVYQDEQHDSDGYYVVDGKGYWLCKEPATDGGSNPQSCSILYDTDIIYNGLNEAVFRGVFYNSEGQVVEITPQWRIEGDGSELLNVRYDGNSILISADDRKLINKTFLLFLVAPGYSEVSTTLTVRALI